MIFIIEYEFLSCAYIISLFSFIHKLYQLVNLKKKYKLYSKKKVDCKDSEHSADDIYEEENEASRKTFYRFNA
ncbi:hypothetical protein HZS_6792 [Henneguya salminicola]|nr:hypothetical protein HZS_6792 [Henneguya salminicola]